MSDNRKRLAEGVQLISTQPFNADTLLQFISLTYKTYAQGIGIPHEQVMQIIQDNIDPDRVMISKKRLAELEDAETAIQYLNMAGVDNWSGCEYAYELAREDGVDISI